MSPRSMPEEAVHGPALARPATESRVALPSPAGDWRPARRLAGSAVPKYPADVTTLAARSHWSGAAGPSENVPSQLSHSSTQMVSPLGVGRTPSSTRVPLQLGQMRVPKATKGT